MSERDASDQRAAIPEHIHCPKCGYHLRGNTSDRCPECGYGLEAIRSDASVVPWTRRREIGRLTAYGRSVWMVTFRLPVFCSEYARVVSYADAQAFRWFTVLLAWIPALLGTAVIYFVGLPELGGQANSFPWLVDTPTLQEQAFNEVWPAGLMLICLLLFLAAATGIPSYFFHPRRLPTQLQNNAIAMSYYAAGPLSLSFVAVFLAVLGIAFFGAPYLYSPALLVATACVAAILAGRWLMTLVRIMSVTMPELVRRRVALALCMPLLWLASGGALLLGLPLAVLYVLVAVASLS